MGKVSIPASPTINMISIPQFLGADFTNQSAYVSPYRSPDMQNMIRESTGKVRKWIGWHTVYHYNAQINGFHLYKDEKGEKLLVHAGDKLYYYGDTETVLYSGMNDKRSVSRQVNGRLVIADGKKLLMFGNFAESDAEDDFKVKTVESEAYVPTVVINRKATGGGITYEPINLLGTQRIDSFYADGTSKEYQLSATEITGVDKIEQLNSSGAWDVMSASNYSVNTTSGKVTFNTAPAVSVIQGEDNIKITYSKTVDGYADRINKCDIMTLYGVNGARDRIFLAGDEKYPNRDYYCQMDNVTYWGDLWYLVVGQDNSKIIGYSTINDKLATHLDRSDDNTNIIMRTGAVSESGDAQFTLTGSYQGNGAISKYSFANLETEPIFMTKDGIMAVTPSDVIGERYAQLRSYYLNGKLLKENLEEAVCCTFDRFYVCAVGGHLYALDGTQAHTESNMPYSSRQYEGFYRTNVPARVIATLNDKLTFGTSDGNICEFYTDYENVNNFNDDGRTINAYWTTPDLTGKYFHYKKRFKTISTLLGSASRTSVEISAKYDDTNEVVVEYDASRARYFCFSQLSFSTIDFEGDAMAQVIREKISIKPDNRKVQFIYKNDILNEAFALYESIIEYTMSRG